MKYRTIRETSREYDLPEAMLRARLRQQLLPGFYTGVKFMVDVEALESMLAEESQQNLKPRAG